jgi:hypothetical protein
LSGCIDLVRGWLSDTTEAHEWNDIDAWRATIIEEALDAIADYDEYLELWILLAVPFNLADMIFSHRYASDGFTPSHVWATHLIGLAAVEHPQQPHNIAEDDAIIDRVEAEARKWQIEVIWAILRNAPIPPLEST